MSKKCDREDCKEANRCQNKKNCPCRPGAPTYPEATPKELRDKVYPGGGGGFSIFPPFF